MSIVIFPQKKSPEPVIAAQHPDRLEEVLTGIGAIANAIDVVGNKSAMMAQGIVALQKGLETLETIYGAIADPGDHEQFLRETRVINSRLQSELTNLASILLRTGMAAEDMREHYRPIERRRSS